MNIVFFNLVNVEGQRMSFYGICGHLRSCRGEGFGDFKSDRSIDKWQIGSRRTRKNITRDRRGRSW